MPRDSYEYARDSAAVNRQTTGRGVEGPSASARPPRDKCYRVYCHYSGARGALSCKARRGRAYGYAYAGTSEGSTLKALEKVDARGQAGQGIIDSVSGDREANARRACILLSVHADFPASSGNKLLTVPLLSRACSHATFTLP